MRPRPRHGLGLDLALVAGIAFLRAAFLFATRADPVFRVPYLDGAFYHVWARSLAAGHGDFQGPYFLGPAYPYFLSALYRLFGPEPMVARVVQSAFGVLDAALILALGRRLFGAAAARIAVVLFALYGPLVFYENLLVMESLLVVLTLGALAVLLVPDWRATWRGALAGLLLGLATLARPTVLAAAPAVWLALRRPPVPRRAAAVGKSERAATRAATEGASDAATRGAWMAGAVCACVWLLVLLPVVVRNARQGGGLAITTNGGVNFYAGNSAGANGRYHEPAGVRFFANPVLESPSQAALPPAVAARTLTVRAVAGSDLAADSHLWWRRALDWMRTNPRAAVGLFLRKLWLVLQAREVPQIESYAFHAQRLGFLQLFRLDFGWLWPLAALGIWRASRDHSPGLGILVAFVAAMLVPCVVFFVTARYRLAVVPEVALLAGMGGATLVRRFRPREIRQAAAALAMVIVLAVVTRLGAHPPRGAAGWEQAQMAERLYALGDLAGAIEYQERAAALLQDRYEVPLNLALYWSERREPGDLERAERLLRDLTRRWPREPLLSFNLGVVLEDQGRLDEARAAWREALAADPRFEPARSRLQLSKPLPSAPQGH